MKLYKKIILVLLIVIFSALLFHLLEKRRVLFTQNKNNTLEGFFTGTTMNSEYMNVQDLMNPVGIKNISAVNANRKLKEFVIKSSYNSAQTGTYMNLEMIKYVLSRGCRFLDFEVFSFNDVPYVSFTSDNKFMNIDAKNKLLFNDVMSTISAYGFGSPCPNPNDPLFIHLRIKSLNSKVFSMISNIIHNILGDKLNGCDVTPDTTLASLIGKVVLIVDKTTAPDYKKFSACNPTDKSCVDLTTEVNMESGGDYLRIYKYTDLMNLAILPPYIFSDGTTDIKTLRLVIPDDSSVISNPSPYSFIVDYGSQFVTYSFCNKDNNLVNYEKIFSENKSAFVPMSQMIPYLQELNDNEDI